ncbi:MAG: lysozyme inhibitor LprI family protein [Pseudomonadota bacterium]
MHDILRSVAVIAAVLLLPSPGGAQGPRAPSFDCDKAGTPDEKTICDQFALAWLDRQLDRAWQEAVQRAGAGGQSDLKAKQKAWLADRRGCREDVSCLQDSYLRRLRELSATRREGLNLTGALRYEVAENYTGGLSVVHHDDDTLAGAIETVSGPSFHLCNIYFEGARKIGTSYLWTGPREEAGFDGKQCKILFQPQEGAIRIDSLDCEYYCGARGGFDAKYE